MIIHIIIIKKQRMMNNLIKIVLISSAVYGAYIDTDGDRRAGAGAAPIHILLIL
jgi:hypothetical protein